MSFDLSTVIRSSVVLLGALIVNTVLRRAAASTRHSICTIALLAALAVPFLSNAFPNLTLPLFPISPGTAKVPEHVILAEKLPHTSDNLSAPVSTDPVQSQLPPATEATEIPWLMRIWAAGAFLIALRWLIGIYDVHHLRRNSSPVQNQNWYDLLASIERELSIQARVSLRIGGVAIPPMTWGLIHPTILLPAAALSWNTERLRFVLAHELAHVKRKEGWTQLLMQTATIVYWFNPLAWCAAYRMRIERERACDDLVLTLGANAEDYAEHLLDIARDVTSAWNIAAVSMVHPSQLETRLRAILDHRNRRRGISWLQTGIVVAGAALLTIPVASTHVIAMPLAPRLLAAMPGAPEPVHSSPPFAVAAPQTIEKPQVPPSFAMVIVLDKSGSMGGEKMDFAKEAANSALALMLDDQWFGIVTFNDQSDWAIPLRRSKDRTEMQRQIDQIVAVGETNIYPALRDAYVALTKVEAAKKHVVLLTDGRSQPGNYPMLLEDMNKANITVSTIALGAGADRDVLAEIANLGHGRMYVVLPQETIKLPEIFRAETQLFQRPPGGAIGPAERSLFDVVSIKPNNSGIAPSAFGLAAAANETPAGCHGTDRGNRLVPLGQCIFHNVTVGMLFSTFWNQPSEKISNVPNWATSDGFDVQAKAAAPVTTAELASMMRLALEDRFKLAFHRETRDVSGLSLVLSSGGPKLNHTGEGGGNSGLSGVFNRGFATARNASIDQLILFLAGGLGRPITDSTGLTGRYDFSLRWIPEALATVNDAALPAGPSIFSALKEQLGLQLNPTRLSVEFAVIDHVERPTPN